MLKLTVRIYSMLECILDKKFITFFLCQLITFYMNHNNQQLNLNVYLIKTFFRFLPGLKKEKKDLTTKTAFPLKDRGGLQSLCSALLDTFEYPGRNGTD